MGRDVGVCVVSAPRRVDVEGRVSVGLSDTRSEDADTAFGLTDVGVCFSVAASRLQVADPARNYG